jgi:hypothetical protein
MGGVRVHIRLWWGTAEKKTTWKTYAKMERH